MKLEKIKYPVQFVVAIFLALSFYYLPNFKARYNFDHFIPVQDPYYFETQRFKKEIGDGDLYIMLAISLHKQTIFDSASVSLIHDVTNLIRDMPLVDEVVSLSNTQDVIKGPSGWIRISSLRKGMASYQGDSIRIFKDPRVRRWLISDDATSFCLFVKVKEDLTEEDKRNFIHNIENIQYPDFVSSYHLGGKINTEVQYVRILESENLRLTPIFLVVVLAVIFGFYRTLQSVLIPLISLTISLILMYGYAAFIGRTLNLSSLMYPTIIVVIGTSDLIHLYSKYLVLRTYHNRWDAIHLALHELRSVLFLTSFTTAIGFLTIATSTIPQVKQFGVDGAVGISIALLVTLFFTPIVITWFPDRKTVPVNNIWLRLPRRIVHLTSHRRFLIACISLGVTILSVVGFSRVNTNNKIVGNISDNHKLAIDFHFFESQYAGVRRIQFLIEPGNGLRWSDPTILSQFDRFEKFVVSLPESRYVLSNLTAVKSYHRALNGGSWSAYTVPNDPRIISRFRKEYETRGSDFYGSRETRNGYLVVSLMDTGRAQVEKTVALVSNWIANNLDSSLIGIRISGSDLLIDKNNEYLVKEMFTSFGLAFILIGILMGWLFRNWIIVLISMAVNILPLLMTGGVMGFFGIPLSGTTAIIFTIGFVIAVDDTIHFMTRYKSELIADQTGAIDNTIYSVTQPIVITSVILVIGYLVPMFSTVREARYQGILIGATLFFAMLADLFLLPALLRISKK